jgi:hypothetical protein
MARRFYTCIIVPDASQRLHKLKISEKALFAAAVVGILSFFVAVAWVSATSTWLLKPPITTNFRRETPTSG